MTTRPTPTEVGLTRSERLDRLPFNSQHRRLLVGSGIGWALDAMDVGLISFVMAALAQQWALTPTQLSWIGSIGFVGMAIGASLGGLLADRIGRRNVFAVTLLIYGLATGAAGLSTGLAMLIALRFVVGLGLGAELPVASTLVSEYAPTRIRGRVVVILEAFWAVGWILAALIGYFVVPASENGWRWALFIGIVPAAYALYVRARLPESVRFLENKGRTAEAEEAVRAFESASGIEPVASPAADPVPPARWSELWSDGLRRRTVALWAAWFGVNFSYYGAFIWIPSLLVSQGFSLTKSFGFTLIITLAQLPGYAAAAFLIEAWGRRADPRHVPRRLRHLGLRLRAGRQRGCDHRRRLRALLLQPRCLGCALRRHAGGLSDVVARHGSRLRRRVRANRLHPCAAVGPLAARPGRHRTRVHRLRRVLRPRRRGGPRPPGVAGTRTLSLTPVGPISVRGPSVRPGS